MLEIAEGSTDNLLKLVESMLEVARLQAAGVPLELEKVSDSTNPPSRRFSFWKCWPGKRMSTSCWT